MQTNQRSSSTSNKSQKLMKNIRKLSLNSNLKEMMLQAISILIQTLNTVMTTTKTRTNLNCQEVLRRIHQSKPKRTTMKTRSTLMMKSIRSHHRILTMILKANQVLILTKSLMQKNFKTSKNLRNENQNISIK